MVGPTEESAFDNPTGEFIWGPLDFGPLQPGEAYASIFDFGCGCGRNARQLMLQKQVPGRYYGMDICPVLIKWCKKNLAPHNGNFKFTLHNVYHENFAPRNSKVRYRPFEAKDSEFTLVNAHSVFTHLYYDQTEFYMKEAARILADNGLVRTTWLFFNKDFFPVFQPGQHCLFVNEKDMTQAVYYDWQEFVDMAHANGLAVVHVVWTRIPGFQNEVFLGKSSVFKDISDEIRPPENVIGF